MNLPLGLIEEIESYRSEALSGLAEALASTDGVDKINRYLYGEKEFDLRQGLNAYDFLARTYVTKIAKIPVCTFERGRDRDFKSVE